ncbi:MAG: DUF1211 domain-containing protein [Hyphomicrobiales bacterium]|nr:DUF1211 domain-containing protein [Hyphomicrobiales bacterium]
MEKERLTAFSDGVIAIVITIMVLELKAPHGDSWADLARLTPTFLGYVLSFLYVAIYWNNHHHLLSTVTRVNGSILWANMHLLFWLSLVPFSTAWLDENHFAPLPTAVYGVSLLMPAIAYFMLQKTIMRAQGEGSLLRKALGADLKSKGSLLLYIIGVALAFVAPAISLALYVLVALWWLVPDRRIEKLFEQEEEAS